MTHSPLSSLDAQDLLEPAESMRRALTEALLYSEHVYPRVGPRERRRSIRSKLLTALASLERLVGTVETLRGDAKAGR